LGGVVTQKCVTLVTGKMRSLALYKVERSSIRLKPNHYYKFFNVKSVMTSDVVEDLVGGGVFKSCFNVKPVSTFGFRICVNIWSNRIFSPWPPFPISLSFKCLYNVLVVVYDP